MTAVVVALSGNSPPIPKIAAVAALNVPVRAAEAAVAVAQSAAVLDRPDATAAVPVAAAAPLRPAAGGTPAAPMRLAS